jgi:glycosyltransferase involved in cell wall biosynthesis
MKILINFADYLHTADRKRLNTYGGIGYYRQIKPSEQIEGHEVKVIGKEILHFGDTLEEQWDNLFKQYDVFWTSYFSNDRAAAAMYYHAQKHGKKVIIDIDDNYLDVPESNESYNKFKKTKKDRAFLSAILSLADALTVSTEPLRDRLRAHIKSVHGIDKPIYLIPNMNDVKDWLHTPVEKSKDKVYIGYSGSNSHQDDLKMVMPAIAKVMNKHKHVHFELIGAIAKDKIDEYFLGMGFEPESLNRIGLLAATSTFRDYPKWLADQKWDIAIAPLVDTAFTRSKSHIKWMEYSMFKLPTVASRVYPYFMDVFNHKTIEHGVTGFLCKPSEWEATLEKLVLDKELREKIGNNAYEHVRDTWQYKDSEIKNVINEMLENL